MYNNELVKISAERIKKCRKMKGLSHKKLADELIARYGIRISPDVLKVYEINDEFHSRFGDLKGMRIEYLYCLADFYRVSTDYLLGITDIETPSMDIRAISKNTGLSQGAIFALRQNLDDECNGHESLLNTINALLEDEYYPLELMKDDKKYKKLLENPSVLTLSKIDEYLSYEPKQKIRYGIKQGQLVQLSDRESGEFDISYQGEISEAEILENAFLLEIQIRLKKLKDRLKKSK